MITIIDANNLLHRYYYVGGLNKLNVFHDKNDKNDEILNYEIEHELRKEFGTRFEIEKEKFEQLKEKTNNEEMSGIIYGLLRKVISFFKNKQSNEFFIFVWDQKATRKLALFSDYKADRILQEDSLRRQRVCFQELLNILDIQHIQLVGEEADDVIASLTVKARKQGHRVCIYSQDHDFEQLISKNVTLLFESGKTKIVKDLNYVREKYNIEPSSLGEVMQLTGDSGDSVPGVNGVGIVNGTNLIKANGSIRNILRDVENAKTFNKKGEIVKVSSKLANSIEDAREQILLNKQLVVLNTSLSVPEIQTTINPDWLKYYMFLYHYNLQSLMSLKSFNACRRALCYTTI